MNVEVSEPEGAGEGVKEEKPPIFMQSAFAAPPSPQLFDTSERDVRALMDLAL